VPRGPAAESYFFLGVKLVEQDRCVPCALTVTLTLTVYPGVAPLILKSMAAVPLELAVAV
jgi:hypothetical protein